MKKTDEELMQRKYMELQVARQQLNIFAEQKKMVDERVSELAVTIETLKKMKTVKSGEEMWSALGSGSFIKSAVKDVDNVLVSVGAGIAIREERAAAIRILEKRMGEMNIVDRDTVKEMQKYSAQAESLENELKELIEKNEKSWDK